MAVITVIIITLLLSAFFSGMEIAFVNANKLKIEVDKKQGKLSGRLLSAFARRPSRFLSAMLLGNNIALVLYGTAFVLLIRQQMQLRLPARLDHEWIMILLISLMATTLLLIFAELLPKLLFRINPNRILSALAIPALLIYILLYPIMLLMTGMAEVILRTVFRIRFTTETYRFSVLDLDEYVREFAPEEDQPEEHVQAMQIFQNAMDFRNVKLRECMVPRPEIKALEAEDTVHELRETLVASGFSKILIYKDSIDNVIGYAHAFDLFRFPDEINSVLKPVIFFPETMLASDALSHLIREHKSLAVVVDEFGGTSGLVTTEDIIEEILGEIDDEFDVEDLTERQLGDDEFLFSARLEIDYLNETYRLDLPEGEEYETLAGLILEHNQNIPEKGEEISIDRFIFTITQATSTRIEQVHLRVLDE